MIRKQQLIFTIGLLCGLLLAGCVSPVPDEPEPVVPMDTIPLPQDTVPSVIDTVPAQVIDTLYYPVTLTTSYNSVQPMTGLVLWSDNASDRNATYGESIALEFAYCLPCRVVTGKENGEIQYDWTSFDRWLKRVAARNHQAVVRFRYCYPGGEQINGVTGATAVPDYIKALPDYEETYAKNPNSDGNTYYPDWRSEELKWFTIQFYKDFAARYNNDPRIAFLEIGFGHWGEYHIYGTELNLGRNFPSKEYQREFFLAIAPYVQIPWLVSIDVADRYYSPFLDYADLLQLDFGLFDDSFMHKDHEGGWNENLWKAIGGYTNHWKTGACGGEISYYSNRDQREFLNPNGLYGRVFEDQAAKYHLTFMIANDAPDGPYGTAERFKEASMAMGYHFEVRECKQNTERTLLLLANTGIAPIYRDAYLSLNREVNSQTLKGLLPNQCQWFEFSIGRDEYESLNLQIVSEHILPTQSIGYTVATEN